MCRRRFTPPFRKRLRFALRTSSTLAVRTTASVYVPQALHAAVPQRSALRTAHKLHSCSTH
ncbi:hypothetical protein GS535_04335 [Saccharibacter sp. EH611]|nr:hypothetical protein [Saccharibacter sp. EH611]